MDDTAAAVQTRMLLPALKPRVCSTKPPLVSSTLPASPAGAKIQPDRLASRKPAAGEAGRQGRAVA
jgi:hypothetical protein